MTALPTFRIDRRISWYREHGDRGDASDRGCWYFASLPNDRRRRPGGRFDLPDPEGTCYLAETRGAAIRERVGRYLASGTPIPPEALNNRVVSAVTVPAPGGPLADLTDPAAAHQRVTGEIHTTPDYRLTVQWAAAARRDGFGGLRYVPRFTPGQESALALFGLAGPRSDGALRSTRPLTDVLVEEGYDPRRSALPGTGTALTYVDDDADPESAD